MLVRGLVGGPFIFVRSVFVAQEQEEPGKVMEVLTKALNELKASLKLSNSAVTKAQKTAGEKTPVVNIKHDEGRFYFMYTVKVTLSVYILRESRIYTAVEKIKTQFLYRWIICFLETFVSLEYLIVHEAMKCGAILTRIPC